MAQRELAEGTTKQQAEPKQHKAASARRGNRKRVWKRIGIGAISVVVVVGAVFVWAMQNSRYPDRINMGTCGMQGMDMGNMSMNGMAMSGTSTGQSNNNASTTCTSVDSLQAPTFAAHIDTFDLTAQPAHLSFGAGQSADAWTFNGTSPGPTLRVKQGDLVVVHVTNHLSAGVTIHWHGIAVPNSADGVAGVTQDAIKPGETYTYRFIAKDAGTYWYHSHQESSEETGRGLFGMIVVDPARPAVHDDVDVPIALHSWNGLTLNGTANTLNIPAQPGQWVRLRLVNTGNNPQTLTIVGAPFQVAALDGHELHNPGFLTAVPVEVDAGQRYDLRFQMPEQGPVALLAADENATTYHKTPAALVGLPGSTLVGSIPTVGRFFDFADYGQPESSAITLQSHFDASYTITLGVSVGFSNGRPGPVFTLDGKTFPQTPMLVVHPGQLVKLHFENNGGGIHPMHLHGHTFQVLARNGKPLTGSPVYLDTIALHPHESYDVAFVADNPGLWMIHCHNLFHANHGMDMMLVYSNISTPYSIGNASGNFPD